MRIEVLTQASKQAGESTVQRRLGEAALQEMDAAFDGDDFAAAQRLLDVARACAEEGRFDFMVVGLPLRLPGGTGSPWNPIAIF